jgi:hypothetical protein
MEAIARMGGSSNRDWVAPHEQPASNKGAQRVVRVTVWAICTQKYCVRATVSIGVNKTRAIKPIAAKKAAICQDLMMIELFLRA